MKDDEAKLIADQELARQKKAAEQQAEAEANAQQESATQDSANYQTFLAEEDAASQQAGMQAEEQQQAESPEEKALSWMKTIAKFVTLRFLIEHAEEAEASDPDATLGDKILSTLKDLIDQTIIKGFDETTSGFKAFLDGGKEIQMDLKNSAVSLVGADGFDQNDFKAVTSLVSSAGGSELDIGSLPSESSKFDAFQAAGESNLGITGISDDDKEQFKQMAIQGGKMLLMGG